MTTPLNPYQEKGQALIERAPEQFLDLLDVLPTGGQNLVTVCTRTIALLQHTAPDWVGTAYCCYAYCLKELQQYRPALDAAKTAKQLKFNLIGAWYYYDAVVTSLNFLDDLPTALSTVDDAIQFYRREQSPLDEADHLSRKANILKQIASPRSRNEHSLKEAKDRVLEAIEAILMSVSISGDWGDLEEEFDALARIVARCDLEPGDFAFLNKIGPSARPVVDKYFDFAKLKTLGASENFNRAVEARKDGDRDAAARWLRRACKLAPETTEEDRAFKTFLTYQHGVNLLKLHNLENAGSQMSPTQLSAIDEIRLVWRECLRLYSTISERHLADFNKRFADLTEARNAILHDRLFTRT